jgi:hypothetical protein
MALEGELKGLEGTTCTCGEHLDLSVCRSQAGYYLGYFCLNCGPYSRETGYWDTEEEARQALANCRSRRIRDTEFHK